MTRLKPNSKALYKPLANPMAMTAISPPYVHREAGDISPENPASQKPLATTFCRKFPLALLVSRREYDKYSVRSRRERPPLNDKNKADRGNLDERLNPVYQSVNPQTSQRQTISHCDWLSMPYRSTNQSEDNVLSGWFSGNVSALLEFSAKTFGSKTRLQGSVVWREMQLHHHFYRTRRHVFSNAEHGEPEDCWWQVWSRCSGMMNFFICPLDIECSWPSTNALIALLGGQQPQASHELTWIMCLSVTDGESQLKTPLPFGSRKLSSIIPLCRLGYHFALLVRMMEQSNYVRQLRLMTLPLKSWNGNGTNGVNRLDRKLQNVFNMVRESYAKAVVASAWVADNTFQHESTSKDGLSERDFSRRTKLWQLQPLYGKYTVLTADDDDEAVLVYLLMYENFLMVGPDVLILRDFGSFWLRTSGNAEAAVAGYIGVGIVSSNPAEPSPLDWIPDDSLLYAVRLITFVKYVQKLANLECADDIVLVFEEEQKAQVFSDELTKVVTHEVEAGGFGLMDADPSVVLEWLDAKNGDLRDLQLTALEQLCNEVLFSDNVDVFCERYPPRCVLPVLCRIFLDDQAPPMVLEANARAVSYYLDMELEWCNYITHYNDVMSALASHLECVDMSSTKSNEFGQQLIKLLKIICTYDAHPLYSNGGLTAVLRFVRTNASLLHTDVLQAGMELIRCLVSKADPKDPSLHSWIQMLSSLLDFKEPGVVDQTLRAFANLVSRFTRIGADPSPLADPHIVDRLLHRLCVAGGVETTTLQTADTITLNTDSSNAGLPVDSTGTGDARDSVSTAESNPAVVHAITNILVTLCCASSNLTHSLLATDGQFATTLAMLLQRSEDESVVLSVLRLVNILLVLLYQNPNETAKKSPPMSETLCEVTPKTTSLTKARPATMTPKLDEAGSENTSAIGDEPGVNTPNSDKVGETSSAATLLLPTDRDVLHRPVIEAIKRQDLEFLRSSIAEGTIDVNYTDHLGQTLLNWAASFGTPAMVELLCDNGANVRQGVRSPLDYAATFGRVDVCRTLLARGADPNQRDVRGLRPIDRARDHLPYPGCQQVIDLLEQESKRSSNRITCVELQSSPPTPTAVPPRIEIITPNEQEVKGDQISGVWTHHDFVNRLLPVVVDLFDHTPSPVVKRQCFLLVRRMAIFMPSDQLEKVSLFQTQTLPFSFLLTQLIHKVFIEETDEYVLRALELSHCLLTKAASVYVPAFFRLGLVPLIKQLGDIWSHLIPLEEPTTHDTDLMVVNEKQSLIKQSARESVDDKGGELTSDIVNPPEMPMDGLTTPVILATVAGRSKNSVSSMVNFSFSIVALHALPPVILSSVSKETCFGYHNLARRSSGWYSKQLTDVVPLVHLSNHFYTWHDWNLIWIGDLLSVFNRFAFIIIQLHVTDGCLRALAVHTGSSHERIPIVLQPGEPAVERPSLKHHMFRMHQHLVDACNNSEKTALWATETKPEPTTTDDPRSLSSRAMARSPTNRSHVGKRNLHRIGLHLGLRRPPDPPYEPKDKSSRTSNKSSLQRQASSPARVCISSRPFVGHSRNVQAEVRKVSNVAIIGPVICSLRQVLHGTRLCLQMRCPSSPLSPGSTPISEALLFSEDCEIGFSRVRMSPLYCDAPSTVANTPVIAGVSVENPSTCTSQKEHYKATPSCRSSLSLSTLLSELDSELHSDGSNSSQETHMTNADPPELYDFDLLFGLHREQSTTEGSITNLENVETVSLETSRELQRLDELLFPRELVCETYTSGPLSNWLRGDSEYLRAESKDQQERATLRVETIRKQAIKISTALYALLQSAEEVTDRPSANLSHRRSLDGLRSIVGSIWRAFFADKSSQSAVTLRTLSSVFERLADLLNLGEQAVTAYELIVSGLVPSLLLCLSAEYADRWNCPVLPIGLDATTSLLWYLRERRRTFVKHLLPNTGFSCLGVLTRRLVEALELTEHLPLRLYSLMSNKCVNTQSSCDTPDVGEAASPTLRATPNPPLLETNQELVSLPLGVIRAANSSPNHPSFLPKNLHECQQFTDCIDELEIAIIPTLCSQLFSKQDESECTVPWVRQIEGRFSLELEMLPTGEHKTSSTQCLTDWSNAHIRASPLVTVAQLERFLLRMSSRQWYESPRTTLRFWSQMEKAAGRGIVFSPPVNGVTSADCFGGIIDWLATNGGTLPFDDWANPGFIGLVTVASSAGNPAAYILGPRAGALIGNYPVRCTGFGSIARPRRTSDFSTTPTQVENNKNKFGLTSSLMANQENRAWFAVDLGLQLLPTAYSLAYLRQAEVSATPVAPRNWNLEASNDAITWTVLRSHVNDVSIQPQSGSRSTWALDLSAIGQGKPDATGSGKQQGWRFFKIQATGPNANGDGELGLGGLDFYGIVYSAHESVLTAHQITQKINSICSNFKDLEEHSKPPPFPSSIDTPHGRRRTSYRGGTTSVHTNSPSKPEIKPEEQTICESPRSPSESSPLLSQTEDSSDTKRKPEPVSPMADEYEEEEVEEDDLDVDDDDDAVADDTSHSRTISRRLLESLGLMDIGMVSCIRVSRVSWFILLMPDIVPCLPLESYCISMLPVGIRELIYAQFTFNLVIDELMRRTLEGLQNPGVQIACDENLVNLEYADNIVLIFEEEEKAQVFLDELTKVISSVATEDAEALEFAEVVEAIIESNISSNAPPFVDRLTAAANASATTTTTTTTTSLIPPIRKEEYECAVDTSETERQSVGLHVSLPRSDNHERKEGAKVASKLTWFRKMQDDQGVVSDPELSSEPSARRSGTARSSHTDEPLHSARGLVRQTCLTAKADVRKSLRGVETQDDQYRLSASSHLSSKSNRQQRRRPRRPRPRPIVQSTTTSETSAVNLKTTSTPAGDKALTWDEAVEMLRLPNGLIPAFNPYPGYTNAPATTLFVLCNAPTDVRSMCSVPTTNGNSPKQCLVLQLSVMRDTECVAQIFLKNKDSTLFSYIQQVYEILREADEQKTNDKAYKLKLGYRCWSPEDEIEADGRCSAQYADGCSFLKRSDLRLTPSPRHTISYSSGEVQVTMVTEDFPSNVLPEQETDGVPQVPTTPENLLNLLRIFYQLSGIDIPSWIPSPTGDRVFVDSLNRTSTPIGKRKRLQSTQTLLSTTNPIDAEDFVSRRLTKKLLRQIHDPMALATGTLPNWCFNLPRWLSPLFTFTARLELLRASGFGPARSVHWLQNQPLAKVLGTQASLGRSYSAGSSSSTNNQTVIRLGTSTNARTILLSSLLSNSEECSAFGTQHTPASSDMIVFRPTTLTRVLNPTHTTNSATPIVDDGSADTPFLDVLVSSLAANNSRPNGNRELWNCLLSRAVRANVSTAAQQDMKTHQVGRLHKEFVRIPRLPREIMDSTERPGVQLSNKQPVDAPSNRVSQAGSTFWDWAARLMDEHAGRKSELEIQFIGEDGTGLGPTLEFYSLLAAELRRRDGLMWVTDDSSYVPYETLEGGPAMPTVASVATLDSQSQLGGASSAIALSEQSIDLGIETNAYVNTAHGLFPAAWPGDRVPEEVLYRFYIMGIAVAKCLQDNRRIDLPLSPPMLKLLTAYGSIVTMPQTSSSSRDSPITVADTEPNTEAKRPGTDFSRFDALERAFSYMSVGATNLGDSGADIGKFLLSAPYRRLCKANSDTSRQSTEPYWLANLLDLDDFCLIYPDRAQFFRKILEFCGQKFLLNLRAGPHNLDSQKLRDLAVEIFDCSLEDMCIGMEFLPPSSLFGTAGFPLSDHYSWEHEPGITQSACLTFSLEDASAETEVEPVTVHNIELFLLRTLDFALDKGIRKQLDMFKAGFERVLPLRWLALFNGTELSELIGGDSSAHWTREDLLAYTVPCFGFTRQSPTYRMLINVLSNFDLPERRAFLQFTTGCSSLPPGGLKNLHPRLRVVTDFPLLDSAHGQAKRALRDRRSFGMRDTCPDQRNLWSCREKTRRQGTQQLYCEQASLGRRIHSDEQVRKTYAIQDILNDVVPGMDRQDRVQVFVVRTSSLKSCSGPRCGGKSFKDVRRPIAKEPLSSVGHLSKWHKNGCLRVSNQAVSSGADGCNPLKQLHSEFAIVDVELARCAGWVTTLSDFLGQPLSHTEGGNEQRGMKAISKRSCAGHRRLLGLRPRVVNVETRLRLDFDFTLSFVKLHFKQEASPTAFEDE
ncbi:E3 ubiquitin-protein ligase HECTD1, partial [Clonorchis sinensis]